MIYDLRGSLYIFRKSMFRIELVKSSIGEQSETVLIKSLIRKETDPLMLK